VTTAKKIKYRVEPEGPVNQKAFEVWFDLVKAAREVFPNGSISKLTGKEAWQRLADDNEESWKLASEKSSWVGSQNKKFRIMMRDLQRAIVKINSRSHKQHPAWVQRFVDDIKGDEDEAVDSQAEPEEPAEEPAEDDDDISEDGDIMDDDSEDGAVMKRPSAKLTYEYQYDRELK
ncbi:unnamed protein product, partial [Prorocentrum cordatum]